MGLGCLVKEAHLDVDPSIPPKICPVRRIPYSLRDRLKQELDEMEKIHVIEKVTKPTKWSLNIINVLKLFLKGPKKQT
ncbi:unnamed protein product, partial [Iphiclides podalirius]